MYIYMHYEHVHVYMYACSEFLKNVEATFLPLSLVVHAALRPNLDKDKMLLCMLQHRSG